MSPDTRRPSPRHAFTVVELVIAIAIMTLLIGLVMPAFSHLREKARESECMGSLRTIGISVTAYQNFNHGYYPLSSHASGSLYSSDAWLNSLQAFGIKPDHRYCPNDPYVEQRLSSYATNDHFEPLIPGIDYDPFTGERLPGGRRRPYMRASDIPRPSSTVYVGEVAGEGDLDHLHSVGWTSPDEVGEWIAVERHVLGANYLFADTHVEMIQWEKIRANFSESRNMFNPDAAP